MQRADRGRERRPLSVRFGSPRPSAASSSPLCSHLLWKADTHHAGLFILQHCLPLSIPLVPTQLFSCTLSPSHDLKLPLLRGSSRSDPRLIVEPWKFQRFYRTIERMGPFAPRPQRKEISSPGFICCLESVREESSSKSS